MTICVVLVASVDSQLEQEILDAGSEYQHLAGLPKALLPVSGGKRVLDYWWTAIESQRQISDVYLVTNAKSFKHFERWATARGLPSQNVVNDGTTTRASSLGAARDLLLALNRCGYNNDRDVVVVAGDSLFHREFDLAALVADQHVRAGSSLAVSYRLAQGELASSRGVVEVDERTRRVTRFVEKPINDETVSRQACPLFYVLKPAVASLLPEFVDQHGGKPSLGSFMEWAINDKSSNVSSVRLPGCFRLIGDAGLQDYLDMIEHFERMDSPTYSGALGRGRLTTRAYARVGLFGNPSDGYGGKTIALTIANFWAEATIAPSERLCLVPHPLFDPRACSVLFPSSGGARDSPRRWRASTRLTPRCRRDALTRLTSRHRRETRVTPSSRVDATPTQVRLRRVAGPPLHF
jgi:glucuronokinase